jgi:membrane-associated phospholipid phosphatase
LLFGRTWPAILVRDDVYGFYPFHAGPGFGAFPSGHMAAMCALLSVLWLRYPRFRHIYVAAAVVFGAGLVVANYHFVSDVIGGAFLGVTIAMLTDLGRELWRRQRPSSMWARV